MAFLRTFFRVVEKMRKHLDNSSVFLTLREWPNPTKVRSVFSSARITVAILSKRKLSGQWAFLAHCCGQGAFQARPQRQQQIGYVTYVVHLSLLPQNKSLFTKQASTPKDEEETTRTKCFTSTSRDQRIDVSSPETKTAVPVGVRKQIICDRICSRVQQGVG